MAAVSIWQVRVRCRAFAGTWGRTTETVSGLVTLTPRDALDSNLIVSGHFMAFEITAEAFVEIMKYVPTLLQKRIKLGHG